ncbi:uncharacterized protein PHALS_08346 [Plasmopara halstedii]|uniref:Uncharacterized protein n=1 Tax=Plasmopara halstedii TaxID=4781 RepID=A0A0P1ACK3_PLAHL|nr:uncharacterized protein PHALS_08346 [Plasmopara halstedii]CEG38261.1 hypothetical protein PHALS_08346 [Plasmopara halstedii]|eukprot:XP_024574630.1 hypothetical protein PHALS_08346 [Plasmopara halstedii]
MAQKHLLQAQERQRKYYDKKRTSIAFKEGDMVMLDTRRIPSAHVTQDIEGKRAKLAAQSCTLRDFEDGQSEGCQAGTPAKHETI